MNRVSVRVLAALVCASLLVLSFAPEASAAVYWGSRGEQVRRVQERLPEEETIFQMASELILDQNAYRSMAHAVNPYGDGKAADRIAAAILNHFGKGELAEEFSV